MANPFGLFEYDHIVALIVILFVAVGPPLILRQMNNKKLNHHFASGLGWVMLVYFVVKHLYDPLVLVKHGRSGYSSMFANGGIFSLCIVC